MIKETTTENKAYRDLILRNNVDTLDKVWRNAVSKYDDKLCLGTRKILGTEEEKQKDGKVFKKLNLGEYEWMSYREAFDVSCKFGRGLRGLGQQPRTPIAIYAETRAEWILGALGAFSQSIIVSTVYTNLGQEAICHSFNETEVSVVITSSSLLPMFRTILTSCPHIKHLIVIRDQTDPGSQHDLDTRVQVHDFNDVVSLGDSNNVQASPPQPDDVAIIMYTRYDSSETK